MSQRSVEILIGKLITDEALRRAFACDPAAVLLELAAGGHPLSTIEFAALTVTDSELWRRAADALDPRLLKADLKVRR